MDVSPVVNLIGNFTEAGQKIAPALAALGFITGALQLLVAHVIGSPRRQELGKAGMIGSVLGLVAVFFAPQIMATVHAAFGSWGGLAVARTHEVPNHLNVEDTLFLGLTARQVATFMAFASPAYGIWDQLTIAPVPIRGTLAGLIVLAGIAFTLIQPGGRQLDEWVFAVFAYAVTPRRLRWCRPETDPREWCASPPPGWVDFAPRLGWGDEAAIQMTSDNLS